MMYVELCSEKVGPKIEGSLEIGWALAEAIAALALEKEVLVLAQFISSSFALLLNVYRYLCSAIDRTPHIRLSLTCSLTLTMCVTNNVFLLSLCFAQVLLDRYALLHSVAALHRCAHYRACTVAALLI
jgi:hypothetical protein